MAVSNAYSLEPVAGWNRPASTGTIAAGATTTRSATGIETAAATVPGTSSSEASHSPEQPDIVDSCNKWHYADNDDGCYAIGEKFKIKLSDFYSWNPKVGDDCSGLWLHYYVDVGVKSWVAISNGVFVAHYRL